jgi:hypothetical protein
MKSMEGYEEELGAVGETNVPEISEKEGMSGVPESLGEVASEAVGKAVEKGKAAIESDPTLLPEVKRIKSELFTQKADAIKGVIGQFIMEHPTLTSAAVLALSSYLLSEVTIPYAEKANDFYDIANGYMVIRNDNTEFVADVANFVEGINKVVVAASGLFTVVAGGIAAIRYAAER